MPNDVVFFRGASLCPDVMERIAGDAARMGMGADLEVTVWNASEQVVATTASELRRLRGAGVTVHVYRGGTPDSNPRGGDAHHGA